MHREDPVVEYRYAGIEMFEEMIAAISKDIVMIMLHIRKKPEVERKQEVKVTGTNKGDSGSKETCSEKRTRKFSRMILAHAASAIRMDARLSIRTVADAISNKLESCLLCRHDFAPEPANRF